MAKHPKRPRDPNQLAKLVVGIATAVIEEDSAEEKDKAAQAMGRKGAAARHSKLSPEQRADIARTAAAARWKKS